MYILIMMYNDVLHIRVYIYIYITVYMFCIQLYYTRVLYFICAFLEVERDQDPGTDKISSCHLSR